VDVVAVLDVSGSMEGERLEHVKEAMEIFIGKLGPDDRLSVVSFATSVRRLTELTYMSEQGRAVAKEIVDGLVADGSTNMGAALLEGAMVCA
jgi:secreted protein with Ig-like and vWFA domain